jgi:hypothetical protein
MEASTDRKEAPEEFIDERDTRRLSDPDVSITLPASSCPDRAKAQLYHFANMLNLGCCLGAKKIYTCALATKSCLGLAFTRCKNTLAADERDHKGEMSYNRQRATFFMAHCVFKQAMCGWGAVYFSYWFSNCHAKIKECNVNADQMLLFDFLVFVMAVSFFSLLTSVRFYNKGQPLDAATKGLRDIIDTMNKKAQNEDWNSVICGHAKSIRKEITALQSQMQKPEYARCSFAHMVLRSVLAFYTATIVSFREYLIDSCTDKDSICYASDLFAKKPLSSVLFPLFFALIGSYHLRFDQLSHYNSFAKAHMSEDLHYLNQRLIDTLNLDEQPSRGWQQSMDQCMRLLSNWPRGVAEPEHVTLDVVNSIISSSSSLRLTV